jgi:hypothetical protein
MNNTDEETDKRGVVFVAFKIESFNLGTWNPREAFMLQRAGTDMPIHIAGMHKCLKSTTSRMGMLVDFFMNITNTDMRARVKLHYGKPRIIDRDSRVPIPQYLIPQPTCQTGSHTEWMYDLMTYGIPHHILPFTADHKIKVKNHFEYLEMRRTGEEFAINVAIKTVMLPTNSDVLLGKGKPIQEAVGNIRLQAIVDNYVDRYQSSKKTEKTALAVEIVQMVKDVSGRFLSKESGIWIEVPDDIAQNKVSHLLRNRRHMGTKGGFTATSNRGTARTHAAHGVAVDCNMNKRIKV